MRLRPKPAMAALLCAVALRLAWAREQPRQSGPSATIRAGANHARGVNLTLNSDDRLSVISAALDSKVRLYSERDCSHLVHAIYERAGFPYPYASSSDIYAGVDGFQRVSQPKPGDLVVWRGHVGIVIRPSRHTFYSYLRSGPGLDDYKAPYWISRGRPRFYRYLKN